MTWMEVEKQHTLLRSPGAAAVSDSGLQTDVHTHTYTPSLQLVGLPWTGSGNPVLRSLADIATDVDLSKSSVSGPGLGRRSSNDTLRPLGFCKKFGIKLRSATIRDIPPRLAMAPTTGEAAGECPQDGNPGEAENDRNIRNPNPIGADPRADAVCVAVAVAGRKRKNHHRVLDPRWSRSKKAMTLPKSCQVDELDVADTHRRTTEKFGLAARSKSMKHIAPRRMKKVPVTLVEEYLHRQLQEGQRSVDEAEYNDPAPEVAIAAVVAETCGPIAHAVPDDPMNGEEVHDPIEYEVDFIRWENVILPDVHRKSSDFYRPPPVIEDAPESP